MAGNTIGKLFTLTSFGESHGEAIGGIIDGCPSGLMLDMDFVQSELNRRRPGQSNIVTQRNENDKVEFLSGIFEGKTTGAPIGFIVKNKDQQSSDYNHLKNTYRPSHADYTYAQKYGHRDYRGGGRSSARETISRVVAGAIAKLFLKQYGINIQAYVSQVGDIKMSNSSLRNYTLESVESNPVRCPDPDIAQKMISYIETIKNEGDTIGGVISAFISNVPVGLGEPVFDKLQADLAKAMLSINAVKGFEYGSGFEGVKMKGSQHNDIFVQSEKGISTNSNFSGGIQGGISNGEIIYFKVAFKPVATIMNTQSSIDDKGNEIKIEGKGRHDACVVPRAVVIVEAMTAIVLMDHMIRSQCFNSTSK